jgi:putative ABC transport system substrate-binding protein
VNSVVNKDELARLAKEHGIEVVGVAANTATEIADAALALANEDIDAVVQVAGNLTSAAFVSITQATRRAKIPLFGALSSNATDGAQVTMARDYYEGGREAAHMAARIMRGENPANIPLEPLRSSKLLVNEEAARAIGMRIPDSVLAHGIKVGKPASGEPADRAAADSRRK